MLDEFLLECAKKEGGNADDIKFLKDRNLPVSKQQDCMVACIGENFDMVSICIVKNSLPIGNETNISILFINVSNFIQQTGSKWKNPG